MDYNGIWIDLSLLGRYEDIDILHVDAKGGYNAMIIRDDKLLIVRVFGGGWTPGTWTTAPEYIPAHVVSVTEVNLD